MILPEVVEMIQLLDNRILNNFLNCCEIISKNFNKIRFARIINDHVSSYTTSSHIGLIK